MTNLVSDESLEDSYHCEEAQGSSSLPVVRVYRDSEAIRSPQYCSQTCSWSSTPKCISLQSPCDPSDLTTIQAPWLRKMSSLPSRSIFKADAPTSRISRSSTLPKQYNRRESLSRSVEWLFPRPDITPWPSDRCDNDHISRITQTPESQGSSNPASQSVAIQQSLTHIVRTTSKTTYPTSLHSSLWLDSSPVSTRYRRRGHSAAVSFEDSSKSHRKQGSFKSGISFQRTNGEECKAGTKLKGTKTGSPRKLRDILGVDTDGLRRSFSSELVSLGMAPSIRTVGFNTRNIPLAVQVLANPLPKKVDMSQDISWHRRRRICFSDVGDPNGHVVLLIPGLGYTRFISTLMDTTARLLGLRLITIDWKIHKSRLNFARQQFPSFPEVINDILRQVGRYDYSILAHSTGALLAVQLAAVHAYRIDGITLLAPFLPRSLLVRNKCGSNINKLSVFENHSSSTNVYCCALSTGMSAHLTRPALTDFTRWLPEHTRSTETAEGKLSARLWHAATQSISFKHQATLPDVWLLPWLPLLTTKFHILHGKQDFRVPIEYSRCLNAVLRDSELDERSDWGDMHQQILGTPYIIAEVLEHISNNVKK